MTDSVPETDDLVENPDGTDTATALADRPEEEIEAIEATVVTDEPVAVVEPTPDEGAPLDDPLVPGAVSIDPTGKRAAFLQRDSSGKPWLWLLEFENGSTIPLVLESGSESYAFIEESAGPQWSPDGSFLALTARAEGSERTHIRVVDIASGVSAPIVRHPGSDSWPRWSPDGDWIAFVSVRDGKQVISVASAQGDGPATQLTLPAPGQIDREPTWDVKGGRLAFLRTQAATDTTAAGDHIWSVELATGAEKQLTKKVVGRNSLRWGPSRPLVLHVAQEADWDHIAVVNADNQASWTISSETGDKSDPQWADDGNRVLFLRNKGGIVNVCDRATSAASSEVLDPAPGRAWSPRWMPGSTADNRQVFYAFSPATGGPRFYTQQNKKDAERTEFSAPAGWSNGDRELVAPTLVEFNLLKNHKANGLLYRRPENTGPAPTVILLGAKPETGPSAGLDARAQALAAAGFTVFAPTIPGASGAGRKVANARKERTDAESEVDDLLEVIAAIEKNDAVANGQIAIAGEGYGGALALVLAGSRPGAVRAVAAVDPIVDWDVTLDEVEGSTRTWLYENYGLPLANAGRYALRSPSTFAGVIDAPMLLVEHKKDEIHVPLLRSLLDDLDHQYWYQSATGDSVWAAYARVTTFLANAFRGTLEAPTAEAIDEPVTPEVAQAIADIPAPDAATLEAAGAPIEATEETVIEVEDIEPEAVSVFIDSLATEPIAPEAPAPTEAPESPAPPEPAAPPRAPEPARPHVRADEI
jgi:dipeptidyl aminopeptidase/acylaminoacyl peptidase